MRIILSIFRVLSVVVLLPFYNKVELCQGISSLQAISTASSTIAADITNREQQTATTTETTTKTTTKTGQTNDLGDEKDEVAITTTRLEETESAATFNDNNNNNNRTLQKIWMYRNIYPIVYEQRNKIVERTTTTSSSSSSSCLQQQQESPVLLLNGFGMGIFHQHRLMDALLSIRDDHNNDDGYSYNGVVYGIDYLGQGQSWPLDCNDGCSESEYGLRYCANTWMDQIIQFIETIILKDTPENNNECYTSKKKKVHLVGNSVGGYLAACIAASRPDLIDSIVLINATPVWGMNLPGWDGHLPAPPIPKLVGRVLFDFIRNRNTLRRFVERTYVNAGAYDERFIQQIHDCTKGKGGHAAFASMLWSPPAFISFPDGTSTSNLFKILENINCNVLLCFGKDDPLCKPIFAKRMLEHLSTRHRILNNINVQQKYVEMSNVGHCPQHEAPNAVSYLLKRWFHIFDTYDNKKDKNDRDVNNNHSKPGLLLCNIDHEHNFKDNDNEHIVAIKESWGLATLQEKQMHEIALPVTLFDRLTISFL